MKNVLLPIDGSECALRGVSLAIAKLAHYQAPDRTAIHLVNVQPSLPYDITRFVSHEQVAAFHQSEAESVLSSAKALLDAAGVKYTCHIKVGIVAEEITELAEELGCDEIIMGTHGRGALSDLLMGSITLKVLHLAKIPVLLIK